MLTPGSVRFLAIRSPSTFNYSEHLDFSEDDFTVPGPGAERGLQKVFVDPAGLSPRQLIMRMVHRQEEEFAKLGLEFPGLYGRRLHAIDCQGLFCETDKYSRAAFPELKSNRVRIKQEFTQNLAPLPILFPPKWADVNERMAAEELAGGSLPTLPDGQLDFDDVELRLVVAPDRHGADIWPDAGGNDVNDQLDFAIG